MVPDGTTPYVTGFGIRRVPAVRCHTGKPVTGLKTATSSAPHSAAQVIVGFRPPGDADVNTGVRGARRGAGRIATTHHAADQKDQKCAKAAGSNVVAHASASQAYSDVCVVPLLGLTARSSPLRGRSNPMPQCGLPEAQCHEVHHSPFSPRQLAPDSHAPYTSPYPSVPRQFSVSDATEGRRSPHVYQVTEMLTSSSVSRPMNWSRTPTSRGHGLAVSGAGQLLEHATTSHKRQLSPI